MGRLDNLHSPASVAENVFYPSFVLLGAIPLLALFCCLKIDNKRALKMMAMKDHLEHEFEEGTE